MTFVAGFASEVTKLAAKMPPPGLWNRIPGKAKALGALGAGAGAFAFGKKKGVEAGEEGAVGGMQQAYEMGAKDMQEAIMKQLQGG